MGLLYACSDLAMPEFPIIVGLSIIVVGLVISLFTLNDARCHWKNKAEKNDHWLEEAHKARSAIRRVEEILKEYQ